jgi:phage baseplate assembly protein W
MVITDPGVPAKIKKFIPLIAESVHRIINTRPGERLREPFFGCRIKEILFEQNDTFTVGIAGVFIRDAIENYEPRLNIVEVIPTIDNEMLSLKIYFRVKSEFQQLYYTTLQVPR